jgi:hypothetical protein
MTNFRKMAMTSRLSLALANPLGTSLTMTKHLLAFLKNGNCKDLLTISFLHFCYNPRLLTTSSIVPLYLKFKIQRQQNNLILEHDVTYLTPNGPRIFWCKTTQNYPLLKKEPVIIFDKYFSGSNHMIK